MIVYKAPSMKKRMGIFGIFFFHYTSNRGILFLL